MNYGVVGRDEDRSRWTEGAAASRKLLCRSAHPETGLAPDYSSFEGAPCDPSGKGHEHFRFDAFRVMQNMVLDCYWFGGTPDLL